MIEITIKNEKLPTNEVHVSSKKRWIVPNFHSQNYQTAVTLTEKQIYENAARAIEELEYAEEKLKSAQKRVEALRQFASELHQPQPLGNQ